MKAVLAGKWAGEGFAKYPTIANTAYTELLEFIPDEFKDAIFFRQKTWYKNDTEKNGHTVFWDTGFIIFKEEKIVLHSVQVGGRMETYDLAQFDNDRFIFNSTNIFNDLKTIQSQRVFSVNEDRFHYDLNMSIHGADFQNHLAADLKRMS